MSNVKIGLGFGLLGTSNVAAISDVDAQAIMQSAFSNAIQRFDTAPLYGGGLSEERLGRLLQGRPRDSYQLSTKVGRYRPYSSKVANPNNNADDWWDFSRDATFKSVEQSLKRLGTDRLDVVFLHDCDNHIEEAAQGAFAALSELRDQGVIAAIGCGSNSSATHLELLQRIELDILMVAGRYTLLDQSAASLLLPLCLQRGIEVELAAPFNSGILATGPKDPTTRFDYRPADREVRAKVEKIAAVCAEFGVSLKQAALAYPAAHPAINTLMLGLVGPAGLKSNIEDLSTPMPEELWQALEHLGISNFTEQVDL